jgi:hypothetical protein
LLFSSSSQALSHVQPVPRWNTYDHVPERQAPFQAVELHRELHKRLLTW